MAPGPRGDEDGEMAVTSAFQALSIGTCAGMLRSLQAVMQTAAAFAEVRGQSPEQFADARLAPDMFPFALQIHLACNQVRDMVLLLKRETPPTGPFEPPGWAALEARVGETLALLESLPPVDLAGSEDRPVVLPTDDAQEFAFTGLSYVRDWALPNFSFHVVIAYGILRAQGVPIGKVAYLAQVASSRRPAGGAASSAAGEP